MIRPAERRDLPAIAALWNAMIRDSLATFTTEKKTEAGLAAMLEARPDAFWMAEGGAGFITWGPFRSSPGYAHTVEHSIFTARPGDGTGAHLITHALARADAQGHRAMIAAISGENPRAVAFHARHGFDKVGHLPQVGRKAGRWLDLILMQKTIADSPGASG